MRRFFLFIVTLLHSCIVALLLRQPVLAQVSGIPIETIFPPAQTFPTLGSLINIIISNLMILAAVLLFILLIVGGFMVIVKGGAGEAEGADTGKKAITAALLGFAIIFSAYFIIQIIEFLTGVKIFQPPGL